MKLTSRRPTFFKAVHGIFKVPLLEFFPTQGMERSPHCREFSRKEPNIHKITMGFFKRTGTSPAAPGRLSIKPARLRSPWRPGTGALNIGEQTGIIIIIYIYFLLLEFPLKLKNLYVLDRAQNLRSYSLEEGMFTAS